MFGCINEGVLRMPASEYEQDLFERVARARAEFQMPEFVYLAHKGGALLIVALVALSEAITDYLHLPDWPYGYLPLAAAGVVCLLQAKSIDYLPPVENTDGDRIVKIMLCLVAIYLFSGMLLLS
jgi:hypothetical protein